jgi:MoxR-like ATPase
VDRLKVRAEAAQGIQARVEELQRVQSDVDQRFREVRQEADMAAGERDRLRADLAARTEELEAAHTEASRLMALEQDVTRLRNEGDWKEQEIHRLNDLLQVRQKAGERAKEKHYGPLATLDAREDELLADQRIPLDAVSSPRSLEALVKKLQARMHHHRENETDTGRRYREDDIRALLGTLAGSRMIVLKGLSGTGKTSLPMYAARAMGAAVARIPVQSGWRDRMDLLGTYNAFTEEFRPTAFTEAVYTANLPRFKERPFFIILDECNLSRVEYYFADLMSELQDAKEMHTVRLMERTPGDDWPEHLKDGHTLQIPPNVWFFLTANEDESTFELADKTFDRSMVMQMDQVAPPLDIKPQALKPVALSGLHKALRAASQPLSKKTAEWLDALRSELSRPDGLRLSLGNRFPAQAEAFVGVFTKAGGDEATALDLLVSTKVLRKLERERDPSRRKEFEDVKAVLGLAPGKLPRSEAMMDRVISRLS